MMTIREAVVSYRGGNRKAPAIMGPADVARFVRAMVGRDAREHVVALMLDGRHRPIAYQVVAVGTATAALVHPREVFQPAVLVGAVGMILAHNHPSGDPCASREDVELAARIAAAGDLIGIKMLDFVIVGEDDYRALGEDCATSEKAARMKRAHGIETDQAAD
jgi:DNA repair protein RadC